MSFSFSHNECVRGGVPGPAHRGLPALQGLPGANFDFFLIVKNNKVRKYVVMCAKEDK